MYDPKAVGQSPGWDPILVFVIERPNEFLCDSSQAGAAGQDEDGQTKVDVNGKVGGSQGTFY